MSPVRRRGRTLEVDRRIDAPAEAAWDVLVDTRRWPEWGRRSDASSVMIVVSEPDRPDGRGRSAASNSRSRSRPVRIRWNWEVAGVSATGHRVERLDQGCRVVFELPVLAAGYVPVCLLALSRIAERLE